MKYSAVTKGLMKRGVLLALSALIVLSVGSVSGCKKDSQPEKQTDFSENEAYQAEIDIKDYGTICLDLYPDIAPITVKNFVELAESGFYDGLTFHRIVSGFMIQGGDPKGDGTGSAGKTIKGEFAANGIPNSLSHIRGTISMGRRSNPYYDSASCQFFITHVDCQSIDGQYAAFGRVTSGMEVVDAICSQVKNSGPNGAVAKEDQPIINTIRIIRGNGETGTGD